MKHLALIAAMGALCAIAAEAGTLRAGAAKGNITPPIGAIPAGEWNPVPSTNIHDDLWVRCLALDDGKTKMALVVCDLLGVSSDVASEVRRLVAEETDMPGANVMVSGTHTHSAPRITYEYYQADSVAKLDDYQKFVVRRVADTVRNALNNLEPAQFGWTTAHAPEHVFNRRWFLKEGTMPENPFGNKDDKVKMNPTPYSDNLVKPAGPTDPQICLMAVSALDGRPIATFANYALHYVGGKPGTDISADYYGMYNARVSELLQADHLAPAFVSIMSNGTSGDINNVDRINRPPKSYAQYEKMRMVAHDLAQKTIEAYKTIKWQNDVILGAALEKIELGLRHPTSEQLEYAKKIIDGMEPGQPAIKLPEKYAHRINELNKVPERWEFVLQAFRIGDVGIATFPVEVFCEIGLEMKKNIPFNLGFCVSLANGYHGYMPTLEQIAWGGYEAWLGTNRLEPQAAPKMSESLLRMLTALKEQK